METREAARLWARAWKDGWEALDPEQQAAVVGLLARLIAKTLTRQEADDA